MAHDRIGKADYEAALALLLSALSSLEKSHSSPMERAACYTELGRCYNLLGKPGSAVLYLQWALNLLKHEWDAELPRAEAELELGKALVRADNLEQAFTYLAHAYDTFADHQRWDKAAACMESLGMLFNRQENIVRAINSFSMAKQLYRLVEDAAGIHRTEQYLRVLIPKE